MGLGRIAFEPVDEPGLRRAQGEPVVPRLLQRNEELPAAVHRLLVQFVSALLTPNTISIWSVMACRTNLEGFAAYQ